MFKKLVLSNTSDLFESWSINKLLKPKYLVFFKSFNLKLDVKYILFI